MDKNKIEVSDIINYAKSAVHKGTVQILDDDDGFLWDLGDLKLEFRMDNNETTVNYFIKSARRGVEHFHVDNTDVIDLIRQIDDDNKRIMITKAFWGMKFDIVDKALPKKKSRFLRRRYYFG